MIQLFNTPKFKTDASKYDHLLHGTIVKEFEERISEYVGAKYAVTFNSASSAIFLIFNSFKALGLTVSVPSIITPVVPNSLINAGCNVAFNDNIGWVGNEYILHDFGSFKVIDSAQAIRISQFSKHASDNDLMVFSHYPTKPLCGTDGGTVVSNNKEMIDYLRTMALNGMSYSKNNWERKIEFNGWKMYMNSSQADCCLQSLQNLPYKTDAIALVRQYYNEAFYLKNTSDHLYRVPVKDNVSFIENMHSAGIQCGIHYNALHLTKLFKTDYTLPYSELHDRIMASIPMHEALTPKEVKYIIDKVNEFRF
jgi:UDP-4-amino-4,6-dideoxy-L-N-acetyl-beta-L-altrosamine transaminase